MSEDAYGARCEHSGGIGSRPGAAGIHRRAQEKVRAASVGDQTLAGLATSGASFECSAVYTVMMRPMRVYRVVPGARMRQVRPETRSRVERVVDTLERFIGPLAPSEGAGV